VGAGGREGAGGECRPRLVSKEGGVPGESFGKKEGGVWGKEGSLGGGNVTLSRGDASLQERWHGGVWLEAGWPPRGARAHP